MQQASQADSSALCTPREYGTDPPSHVHDVLLGRMQLHALTSEMASDSDGAEALLDRLLLLERLLAGHASETDRRRAWDDTSAAVRYDFAV